jgi:hypothetical protein
MLSRAPFLVKDFKSVGGFGPFSRPFSVRRRLARRQVTGAGGGRDKQSRKRWRRGAVPHGGEDSSESCADLCLHHPATHTSYVLSTVRTTLIAVNGDLSCFFHSFRASFRDPVSSCPPLLLNAEEPEKVVHVAGRLDETATGNVPALITRCTVRPLASSPAPPNNGHLDINLVATTVNEPKNTVRFKY